MESKRQRKIASVLQRDMAEIFRREASNHFHGTIITVSKVRVSPDLGLVRCYLSIFPTNKADEVLDFVKNHAPRLRGELAKQVKNQLRVIPSLYYHLDDSLEYEANIDKILREGGDNPIK